MSPNELNTTLTLHSITNGDTCLRKNPQRGRGTGIFDRFCAHHLCTSCVEVSQRFHLPAPKTNRTIREADGRTLRPIVWGYKAYDSRFYLARSHACEYVAPLGCIE